MDMLYRSVGFSIAKKAQRIFSHLFSEICVLWVEGGGEWGEAEGTKFFQIFRNMLAFIHLHIFNIISTNLHTHSSFAFG